MAHNVDRIIIVTVWVMQYEKQNIKRAREKSSNKARKRVREPMDAMCQMGLK